ncbi:MAG: hypothetical protein IT481_10600 [Gammaproteobacteria bacterium]|nr:hypothetical protein [Gammaproteobacteria bacterium]
MPPPNPGCVGGLHEVCVGVPDLAESITYYEAFGCRAGERGELDAAAARRLYGIDSALRAVRLHHQQADHGLVRLMQWERPLNDGLGLAPNLRCIGSRWGVRASPAHRWYRSSRSSRSSAGSAASAPRARSATQ